MTMMRKANPGARADIPAWLPNPELMAPCLCGFPLHADQPHVVAEGELGFKRWFHMTCWEIMEDLEEADGWEDDDEWEN